MNDAYKHAEDKLINKLNYLKQKTKLKLEKVTITVVRLKDDNKYDYTFSMSKPCIHCTNKIKKAKLKNICWSTNDNSFEYCKVINFTTNQISQKYR